LEFSIFLKICYTKIDSVVRYGTQILHLKKADYSKNLLHLISNFFPKSSIMRKSICFFSFFAFTVLSFYACQKDSPIADNLIETDETGYANVPSNMWSLFQRFEEEALERGYQIDLKTQEISAEISEISEEGVAGSCTYGSHDPGHIVIDQTFWNQASDLLKEMVIFHELGHCSLFRGHTEGSHPNGTCLSIMRSGLEDCNDNYRVSTRETYLDELFENADL
jgi:hypothetical protein